MTIVNERRCGWLSMLLLAGCTTGGDFPGGGFTLSTGGMQEPASTGDDDDDDDDDDWDFPKDGDDAAVIDEFILGLGHLELDPVEPLHEVPCDPSQQVCVPPWEENGATCAWKYFQETRHVERFLALDPNSPALWPGAILRGGDVAEGYLSSVGLPRAPATFSVSLENLAAVPSATMEQPSLSAFRNARNELLADGLNGATAAQVDFTVQSVLSESHLGFLLGASLQWEGVIKLGALYDWNSQGYDHKYLMDFAQTYYTVDLDSPVRPAAMFGPTTTVDLLETAMGEDDPPMYVQSVSFGRRVLFAIETDNSLEEINTAVKVGLFNDTVTAEAKQDALAMLDAAKITAAVLGGSGEVAVETVFGVDALYDYIRAGGEFSADSPGLPIGYKLAYLDNSVARLGFTAVTTEKVCQ